MRILLANIWLISTGGTECWCKAMADEFSRRGHEVALYTPNSGDFFVKMGYRMARPGENFDLILDNHGVSVGKFGGVTIHTCHGIIDVEGPLPGFKNVAVSRRVAKRWGLRDVILNGIDTGRFKPVTGPSRAIRTVLSLCKTNSADAMLREACDIAGVNLRTTYGSEAFDVERLINGADLVVGVGRSLLDAMACGRPVLSFDDRSYYQVRFHGCGYIRRDDFHFSADDNFTGVSTGRSWDAESLAAEFGKYNPADGERNRRWILKNHSVSAAVDKYMRLWAEMTE